MIHDALIIQIVLAAYPNVQGVYLFGSHQAATPDPRSDVDIALLFSHEQTVEERDMAFSDCRFKLEDALAAPVDLVNARQASTVFQKEIISGELIYCGDRYATDEFEMLTLSYYQKLNEERAQILSAFQETGRAYAV